MSIFKSNKNVLNNNESKVLADYIIHEAFLDALPEEDKKTIREQLSLQIDRRIGLIIMDNLNDEGLEEYNKLLQDNPIPDPEKLQQLLNKYIPDYQKKIKVGLDQFVKEAINSFTE